jgi:hypothetical protein
MLWVSTADSIDRGEPSVLALAETVIAVALTVTIYFYYHSLIHLAMSAAIAPLLLLRTSKSQTLALDVSNVLIGRKGELFLRLLDLTQARSINSFVFEVFIASF